MALKPTHRADVDGLRAVAVLGVVLYHFGATWMPGGFTGVDIFFVISGYVITAKLRREIASGDFSILGFYDGRVRRILPALLVMLAIVLLAAYFLLLPDDYADLGASGAYAAAGLANLFFYWNTSYFDQASELRPLLHMWSLGVEEQFYVAWPLILAVGLRFLRPKLFAAVLGAAILLSFGCANWLLSADPKAAFYNPVPRAWELAIGALLVFLPAVQNRAVSAGVSIAGVALLVCSLFAVSTAAPFPGLNAAYACIGTALLIWPKASEPVAKVLSWRPFVGIGLISYSLYLWHWPVLVLYRHYANGGMPSALMTLPLILLCFALAIASWRFVERPFRKPRHAPVRVVLLGIASIAVAAMLSGSISTMAGFPNRLPADLQGIAGLDETWAWDCPRWEPMTANGQTFAVACNFGEPWATADVKAVLWGDSHAQHMAPIVEAAIEGQNVSVFLAYQCAGPVGTPYMMELPDQPDFASKCATWRDNMVTFLHEQPDVSVVMFASFWSSVFANIHSEGEAKGDVATGTEVVRESLGRLFRRIVQPGRTIGIFGDVPIFTGVRPGVCNNQDRTLILRQPCPDETAGRSLESFNIEQGYPFARATGSLIGPDVRVFAMGDALCSTGTCVTSIDGEFIYRDLHHLRRNLGGATRTELAKRFGFTQMFP